MDFSLGDKLKTLSVQMLDSYYAHKRIQHVSCSSMPNREEIADIIYGLFELAYPGFIGKKNITYSNVEPFLCQKLDDLSSRLYQQVYQCFKCKNDLSDNQASQKAGEITTEFMLSLPDIREKLVHDILAAYKGDPAARGTDEVIFSYPATIAIGTYRFAHVLWHLQVPLVPRIMTEHAHSLTGIDIHPGAHIHRGFFIDHGTGVVIGETCTIHDNCKLYQGVTLGAISFPHDDDGQIIRGHKRHPTLDEGVVVYSNATILGNVTIGKGAMVGGGVFLTRSVPPGCIVSSRPAELRYRTGCDALKNPHFTDFDI